MKFLSAICLFFAVAIGWSTPTYRVMLKDRVAGKAYMKLIDEPDQGRRVIMSIFLDATNAKIRIRSEALYDSNGVPKERSIETESGKNKDLTKAIFSKGFATVVHTTNGKSTSKDYAIDPEFTVRDASIFWFKGRKPKDGDQCSFFSFEFSTMRWTSVRVLYEGKKAIKVNDAEVDGYWVRAIRGESEVLVVYDEAGTILMYDDGKFRLERVQDTK